MIFPRVLLIEDNEQASLELARIGCDTRGTELMRDKYFFYAIKIPDLSCTQANIIKQEMLSIGGEAANNKGTINHSIKKTDVLLSGTLSQYKKLIKKLDLPYFNLRPLSEEMKKTIKNYSSVPPAISFKNKKLDFKKRTYIMGILNITPDSFSDGGRYFKIEDAIKKARELIGSGADIIDIGGESTRPGAEIVSEEEELKRILPAVKILAKEKKCLISVDTRKSGVAEAALKAGAHIINDISALRFDRNMAKVIAKHKAAVILMHMKNNPKTMQKNPFYKDMFGEISKHLKKGIEIALKTGILPDRIVLDPGFGFGKTLEHNLILLNKLKEFKSLGMPLLVGTSRKSMIGKILGAKTDSRLMGTAATVAIAILNGANIIRVHDVGEMKEVAKVADSIVRRK